MRVAFGLLLEISFTLSLGIQEYDSYGSYWAQPQVNQINTEIQDYSPNYQTTSPNLRQDIIDFCAAIGLVPSQTLLTGAGVSKTNHDVLSVLLDAKNCNE